MTVGWLRSRTTFHHCRRNTHLASWLWTGIGTTHLVSLLNQRPDHTQMYIFNGISFRRCSDLVSLLIANYAPHFISVSGVLTTLKCRYLSELVITGVLTSFHYWQNRSPRFISVNAVFTVLKCGYSLEFSHRCATSQSVTSTDWCRKSTTPSSILKNTSSRNLQRPHREPLFKLFPGLATNLIAHFFGLRFQAKFIL